MSEHEPNVTVEIAVVAVRCHRRRNRGGAAMSTPLFKPGQWAKRHLEEWATLGAGADMETADFLSIRRW